MARELCPGRVSDVCWHTREEGDVLHPRELVELKNEMATPLRMIFTRSLHEGQLPPAWKEANVTPIYKKDKRHIPGNYRSVSLTSMAGKCMERPPITETTRLHPGTILRHTAASRTGLLDASYRRGEGETSTPYFLTSQRRLTTYLTNVYS